MFVFMSRGARARFQYGVEVFGACSVCTYDFDWLENPLVRCKGFACYLEVHIGCYGLLTYPEEPWYCRTCENEELGDRTECVLCPSEAGAIMRTDTGRWAHVVCARYMPGARFGNPTSLEPIVLNLISTQRYNKTCYICVDMGDSHKANAGACMKCCHLGCDKEFHVTCAQHLGLLTEIRGNLLDKSQLCGYCSDHSHHKGISNA